MAKKNIEDEEFEKLFREFIDPEKESDEAPEDESTDNLNDPTDETLPFPREISDKVADAMMNKDRPERYFKDDVASVSLEMVAPNFTKGSFWNSSVEVTFRPKPKIRFRQHRFACFIYDENYFPICSGAKECEPKRPKSRAMTLRMTTSHIWIPGNYILMVHDTWSTDVVQIDFTIDEELNTKLGAPRLCQYGEPQQVLVTCMEGDSDDWDFVSHRPGVAQFRRKAMEACRLLLYNEIRKEKGIGEMDASESLLICTRNDDIDEEFLKHFMKLMFPGCHSVYADCATLYNPGCANPYEPLTDLLNVNMRALCLTNLKELLGPNGKVMMRSVIDKVRDSRGSLSLWLCGTRLEIDELMGLYPSLRQFFFAGSYVEQQPYTPFELVDAFLTGVVNEYMKPNFPVKDRLTRTVLQGYRQGTLTSWSLADVHRFVIEEIRPRYLQRVMADMLDDSAKYLQEEDVPFEKLVSGSSAFDESIRELNEMIGLDTVKQGIMTMANQARLFSERQRRGLHTSNKMIFHSVFTGNPGTGKTTVARKLGKIYRSLGLLSKGEVIAVDRTRLVGQYLGQTEDNMKVVLEEAKGNVLFIDEAYDLSTGSDDRKDFGYRVLESLLTVLTQPNPDMLIIFAGYEKEMNAMLNSNPGLQGRFPYHYRFDDYSADQLMEIALKLFERDEYILTDEAAAEMQDDITQVLNQKLPNFGNARWVEQFVNNGIIPAMADRIYASGSNDLQHIEAADVSKAFEKFKPAPIDLKSTRHRVKGFRA